MRKTKFEHIKELERENINYDVVEKIKSHLRKTDERGYILFITGIYTGLRISEILRLKISDVKDKRFIYLREKKTKRLIKVIIPDYLLKEYKWYCNDKAMDEYLIKSREVVNRPLARERAYAIVKEIGKAFGIENLGTHTLRKIHYCYYINPLSYLTEKEGNINE